jgi:hypothetical protein
MGSRYCVASCVDETSERGARTLHRCKQWCPTRTLHCCKQWRAQCVLVVLVVEDAPKLLAIVARMVSRPDARPDD